jgi:hypothetical protein
MKNVFGVRKTVRMVTKMAKQAAKTAAASVIDAANKGVLNSAKGASNNKVNVNARNAARRALKRVRRA